MGRLTLRLPDTLHQQLKKMADHERVSMNQYIVYALTRQMTLAYTVSPIPESAVEEQRAAYAALLQGLGEASFAEISAALDEREEVAPEEALTPQVVKRLKEKLTRSSP